MEERPNASDKAFWAENTCESIQKKTVGYSPREKRNMRISFLKNAIAKISAKEDIAQEDWIEFQEKVGDIVQYLPIKSQQEKLDYGKGLKTITNFKTYVLKKFNYVSNGFYLRIWLTVGMILGAVIGAVFGHVLAGLSLGIGIGLVAGSFQDRKALANDRVL